MRVIRRISAVLIGFVLFLAGVLKLMDPVGARLVVEEYLKFMHLDFLTGISGLIGSGMALLETLLGAALITGVWRKVVAVVTGVVLGFFTILTFFLYIRNPRMDCGCFGEAIHLTHLQSLLKNVVLMVLWAIACLPLRKQEQTRKIKYVSFPIVAISVCLFLLYSSLSIPLVEFTPFKAGTELMLPEDIEDPTDENAPTLSLSDAAGEYVDEMLMEGDLLAVSVYAPEKLGPQEWEKIENLHPEPLQRRRRLYTGRPDRHEMGHPPPAGRAETRRTRLHRRDGVAPGGEQRRPPEVPGVPALCIRSHVTAVGKRGCRRCLPSQRTSARRKRGSSDSRSPAPSRKPR